MLFPRFVALLAVSTGCLAVARAAPCPDPPLTADAALTPDGSANLLTFGVGTACWWSISEDGDAVVVRRFDLATTTPTAVRWDEARRSICIDVVDVDGTRRERVFPQVAP